LPSVKVAFLIHFGISLIIFIGLAAIMRFIWFPDDLFFMDGGVQGLKIIAPIDLILGPALTLCFYRPWKKNIKLDMGVIAAVQIAALGFGVYQVYSQRTAAIVFAEHRFETLTYKEFKEVSKELEDAGITPKSLKEFGSMPIVVYAKPFAGESRGKYQSSLSERTDRVRSRKLQMDKH